MIELPLKNQSCAILDQAGQRDTPRQLIDCAGLVSATSEDRARGHGDNRHSGDSYQNAFVHKVVAMAKV